jgi:hypothetical protein
VAGKLLVGWIVIDIDATLITAHSAKTGAAVTFKKRVSGSTHWPCGAPTPPSRWRCCYARATPGSVRHEVAHSELLHRLEVQQMLKV